MSPAAVWARALNDASLPGMRQGQPRPFLSGLPAVIHYGQSTTVGFSNVLNVTRVVLVRSGAVTHSTSADQRQVGQAKSAIHRTLGGACLWHVCRM